MNTIQDVKKFIEQEIAEGEEALKVGAFSDPHDGYAIKAVNDEMKRATPYVIAYLKYLLTQLDGPTEHETRLKP